MRDAIVSAVDSVVHYPDVQCEKLKQAIGAYEQVSTDQIFCGNGAAEVIFSLCLAQKPKTALIPAPTFAEYEQALESVDCKVTLYELKEEQGFLLDAGFAEAIASQKPDIVFLCNPNNPTGALTERSLLIQILEICRAQDTLLVLDECFLDFIEEPKAYTMKAYLETAKQLFIVKAFTKRYAMAGVRLGYGLTGNKELMEKMELVTQPWNVSSLAQAAGIAALKETQYVEAGRQLIFQERAYLLEELKKLDLKVYASCANYIFFRGREDLSQQMKKFQILIRDCSNYHNLQPGYFRIAVRTHEENERLIRAMRQIKQETENEEER